MAKKAKKTTRQRAPRKTFNGKPIHDATDPLIVSITRTDIRGAKTGNPEQCGAARAICREQGAVAAHVHRGITFVEFKDRVERYVTPRRLAAETISFDRGASDKYLEGDYRLLPPIGSRKLGSDPRPSTRGGGSDKRGAGPSYPRFEIAGARPRLLRTDDDAL